MASTTTNLGLTKPAYSDDADISDINGNMDLIDAEAGRVRANVAANYDSSETYAVGDYCLHDGSLYKCSTAISSPEAWTAGHWTQIKITGELSALNGKIENFISKDYGTLTWTTDLKTSIVNLLESVYSDCPNNGNILFCGFFTGRGALNGVASRKNSMLNFNISVLNDNLLFGFYATSSSYKVSKATATEL